MQVGIRPSSRRRSPNFRPAIVRALVDRPGCRQNRAVIEYADTGASAELPLWRLAPAT
jgi:hypothetical protein